MQSFLFHQLANEMFGAKCDKCVVKLKAAVGFFKSGIFEKLLQTVKLIYLDDPCGGFVDLINTKSYKIIIILTSLLRTFRRCPMWLLSLTV